MITPEQLGKQPKYIQDEINGLIKQVAELKLQIQHQAGALTHCTGRIKQRVRLNYLKQVTLSDTPVLFYFKNDARMEISIKHNKLTVHANDGRLVVLPQSSSNIELMIGDINT